MAVREEGVDWKERARRDWSGYTPTDGEMGPLLFGAIQNLTDEIVSLRRSLVEVRTQRMMRDLISRGEMDARWKRAFPAAPISPDTPLDEDSWSVRAMNIFLAEGVSTYGDLVEKSEGELLAYRGFGPTVLREVRDVLAARGMMLRGE